MAEIHEAMGNFGSAESEYLRSLAIKEKVLKPGHSGITVTLNKLGDLYRSMGRYEDALPYCERAAKRRRETLGDGHTFTINAVNNLGAVLHALGEHDRALEEFNRALNAVRLRANPDHPAIAMSLARLARLHQDMGHPAKALPLQQRALRIRKDTHGLNHPDTADSMRHLAQLHHALADPSSAREWTTQTHAIERTILSHMLSFTAESERSQFLQTFRPFDLPATLGMSNLLATAVLQYKGIGLDSVLEDRLVAAKSDQPKIREALAQLQTVRRTYERELHTMDKSGTTNRTTLRRRMTQLESQLARHLSGLGQHRRALAVTVKHVQKALSAKSALIEFVRYQQLNDKGHTPSYGAILIRPTGQPTWIPLGAAKPIDEELTRTQNEIRAGQGGENLSASLRKLHHQLWQPIAKHLPKDTREIVVCPDGQLNFVSFTTLLSPKDRLLGEQFNLRYVSSGRDLVRKVHARAGKAMRIFANPQYDQRQAANTSSTDGGFTGSERRDLQSLRLVPLPGSARESQLLVSRAAHWNWQSRSFVGPAATELNLRDVDSPHILHLATHGFFLSRAAKPESPFAFPLRFAESRGLGGVRKQGTPKPPLSVAPKQSNVLLRSPMHRSGLALTGAQGTLDAWKRG